MSSPGALAGRVAVVTGATRGIGRATAVRLARDGATVTVAARDEAACEALATELRDEGARASGIAVDVTDEAAITELYRRTARDHGRIDLCVNNAGAVVDGDEGVLETSATTWREALEVNLTGAFLCIKHQLPHLIRCGGGTIVNVSGTAALLGSATPQIGYDAAKAGLLALTRDVAVAHARDGVRCNAVCPGPIDGPLIRGLVQDEDALADRLVHVPAGRFGTAEEIAETIAFLAGPSSGWLTGVSLPVDGGITAAYNTHPPAARP